MVKKIQKIITISIFLSIIFSIINIIFYVNSINEYEDVYIAKKYISEGSNITLNNFVDYIGIIKVDPKLIKSLNIMKVSKVNQNIILNNRNKISRCKGDFITTNVLKSNYEVPMKHLIGDLSSNVADSNLLIPVLINISDKDKEFSKGVKRGDRIQIWFINNEVIEGKKSISIVPRYKNVPIIGLSKKGEYLEFITIALPSNLAKNYEIEKKISEKMKIIFMPPNYSELKDDKRSKITSIDIANEYKQGKVYDLETDIQIEKFQEVK